MESNILNCRICVTRKVRKRRWYITINIKETVIRVKRKQCNVSSCMYYIYLTFKGPEYTRNKICCQCRCSKILKKLVGCFSQNSVVVFPQIFGKRRIAVIISSQWKMSVVSIFFFNYLRKSDAFSWSAWLLEGYTKIRIEPFF